MEEPTREETLKLVEKQPDHEYERSFESKGDYYGVIVGTALAIILACLQLFINQELAFDLIAVALTTLGIQLLIEGKDRERKGQTLVGIIAVGFALIFVIFSIGVIFHE